MYLRAVRGEKIKCINMIGSAECNGAFKNLFIKSIENPNAPIDPKVAALLEKNGFPKDFLAFLGWEY